MCADWLNGVGLQPATVRRRAAKAQGRTVPGDPLVRAVRWELDRVAFAQDCGFAPDEQQQRVLRSTAPQSLLLCTRQWGKSSVTSVLALHTAIVKAPATILILAKAQRQAVELLRKISAFASALGPVAPQFVGDSVLALETAAGSRILALPGNEASIRGFSAPALIIVDEAARVSDELYFAARPMLATGNGRIIGLSSAWGQFGWFYREWISGGPDWDRVMVRATECPRLDPAWLARERATVGDRVFRREYLCEFGNDDESVFLADDIERAFTNELKPLFPRREALCIAS